MICLNGTEESGGASLPIGAAVVDVVVEVVVVVVDMMVTK